MMSDFQERYASLINDTSGMQAFLEELEGKLPLCETDDQERIIRRRIRIVKDYLKDEAEDDFEI